MSFDGTQLFVDEIHGGGPDTLDRLDTPTNTFTRDVYTFGVGNMSALDLRIAQDPR